MGLAIADDVIGPYEKHPENPIVDYSPEGKQVEDAYVWVQDGLFYMLMADDNEGVVRKHGGALITSEDGVHWSEPMLGYDTTDAYFRGRAGPALRAPAGAAARRPSGVSVPGDAGR
jgi:hypothetical protein